MKRRSAFTLAEVLVTLGIIGVVSAMTIPSLINNYQRQTYVSQLHKVYNELSQGLLQYQTNRNALNLKEAGLNSQANVENFVRNYFKIVNVCDNTLSPCFPVDGSYKKMSGNLHSILGGASLHTSFTLASGSSIRPSYFNNPHMIFAVAIDVNGPKGPNVVGRDFFAFYIYNNGAIDDMNVNSDTGVFEDSPVPLSRELRENNFQSACYSNKPGWGHGCFGRILNDGWQMTY